MSTANQDSEAILFFGDGGICKGMLWTEFEALLDGVLGIPEFAETTMKIVYVQVNLQHFVTGLCFFKLKFDESGYADPKWNIPLSDLLVDADEGPDLGAGEIALVCKSQCPEPMFEDSLLDPSVKKGANDFVIIRDTIAAKGDAMGLPYKSAPKNVPTTQAPAKDDVPVVQPVKNEASDHWQEEREILLATIKQLRVTLQAVEEQWEKEVAEKDYLLESIQSEQETKQRNLIGQVRTLKDLNAALKEQVDNQKNQLTQNEEALERQQSEAAISEAEHISIMKEQYDSLVEQKLGDLKSQMQQRIADKDMELLARQDIIESLEERVHELQKKSHEAAAQSQYEFIAELKDQGLKAVAYHPGIGQITLELDDMAEYLEDTIGYAAKKCLVTKERYQAWLAHHDNPVCQAEAGKGKCGKPVPKVDLPRRFEDGISNVCHGCQGDRGIAAVVSLSR